MASQDKAPGAPTLTRPVRTWALVTGATGGIGAEFARHLATHGCHLVLTGRNQQKLDELVAELGDSGAELVPLVVDLSDPAARTGLHRQLVERGITVTTLVNNAGYGILGDVADTDVDRLLGMVEVNVTALTHLTRLFLPAMLEQRQGTIINVASTASFQAMPGMAAYAASKAYVRSFSTALWHEVKGTGVRIVSISPGPTESAFFEIAGDDTAMTRRRTPADVVTTTFDALQKGRPSVVDGRSNALLACANRLVPPTISTVIARRVLNR